MSEELNPLFKTDSALLDDILISQAGLAGIAIENMVVNKERVRQAFDEPWMRTNRGKWEAWLNDIYDVHSGWNKSRLAILIDGGTIVERERVSQAFLFRGILNNIGIGQTGAIIKTGDELVRIFSEYGDRNVMLENLIRIPCLLISEIADQPPKSAAMGHLYFNDLLQGRLKLNLPTILTFANPNIQTKSYGEFSRLLDELTKQPDNGLRKVYHFRLETKG